MLDFDVVPAVAWLEVGQYLCQIVEGDSSRVCWKCKSLTEILQANVSRVQPEPRHHTPLSASWNDHLTSGYLTRLSSLFILEGISSQSRAVPDTYAIECNIILFKACIYTRLSMTSLVYKLCYDSDSMSNSFCCDNNVKNEKLLPGSQNCRQRGCPAHRGLRPWGRRPANAAHR